ncbi:hypothetical protein R5R35_004984 [Gryllus longicercus]|uniref:Importin-4 n=1 Tax=Gryllus longicercus TaxID=2509291 RepID=A0AAN9Z5B5_9ORTH
MEDIIARLLVADNAVIQQATKDLKASIKNPSAIGDLCTVIVTSKNSQIRQYAAVIMRQRLSKAKIWNHLDSQLKARLTQDILGTLHSEFEQSVVKAIVQLIGTVAKHELNSSNALLLLEFVGKLCSVEVSDDHAQKLRGFFVLCVLSEECPDLFATVLPNIGALVANTLQNEIDAKSPLVWHGLNTMKNLAAHFSDDQSIKSCYSVMLPQMLKAVKALANSEEDMASDLLEMLDDLIENSVITTMHQITPILNMCMELAGSEIKEEQIQIKALSIVDTIVKMKKKAIIKHNLLLPILQTLVQVLQMPCDEDLDYESGNEMNSPVIYGSQVLDGLALNLPPGKLMPHLLESIQMLAVAENPNKKKASYVIMAVTAEGCAEYICNKCFKLYLELVCKGLEEPVVFVRNAALYALGQFAEHLQPEIGKHSEQLMPVLFKFLEHITVNLENLEGKIHLDRVFYALETFIEHSEKETFLPYLAPLIANLLALVTAKESSTHLKQLALSAIGACATTAEDNISPFVPRIVECLSVYLVNQLPEELSCLQVQAIDTMATLARAVSPENFQQVASDCIRYGYIILEKECDPEMEGSIYGLFGAVSAVLKENMKDVMGPVIGSMLKTIESSEGIVVHYDDDDSPGFPGCGDLSDSPDEVDLEVTSDEDEDEEDIAGYSVENVYLDKKAAACYAVKELALNTGAAFNPYLTPCFSPILKLLEYPHDTIKKAALDALTQLCINWSASMELDGKTFENNVSVFIQKCAEIIHTNEEREVVGQALESYGNLLKSAKNFTLKQSTHREAIFNCILDVIHKRTLCQLEEEDSSAEDEENAEQDELLIEYAGDVLPYFGRAMSADDFKPYFVTIFPVLKSKLKESGTVAQRSFAIGIIAECMEPLGPVVLEFSNEILPAFIAGATDEHCDVRNNAVYGLGEMLYHGREKFFLHYENVLQLLSMCLVQETVPKVIDNICGAVARMIVVNANLVPIAQVFPVIINCLPLKKDFKENSIMMKCFMHLYEGGHDIVAQHLEKILHTIIHIIHQKQGEEDALLLAEHLFTCIKRDFPDRVSTLRISEDVIPTYSKLLNK